MKRWKNFVEHIGDLFIASSGDKALDPKRRKISPRVFLRCCWSAAISMLFARRKGGCDRIC
jgi:hypothetical protein